MDRYVPLPPLPPRISRLNELAYDLWWSWTPRAREVFRDLDYPLWRFTDHNPVLLLHLVEPERLDHAAADPEFLRLYDEAVAALDIIRAGAGTWWSQKKGGSAGPIAWITPEFALHQSLPTEASASGVLSGDFCKEASDLGIPLVGVGLMYPRAYAHQRLSAEGWQQENYEYLDWSDAPIGPATCADGSPCRFVLAGGETPLHVAVWQARAGRVTLYLLDTDLEENPAWDRELSSRSFLDDAEARLRQSILLGEGALRALALLGIEPAAWHVAEGAAASVGLARLNALVSSGTSFDTAVARVRETTLFCTRDGAPGRQDEFSFVSVERHLGRMWPGLEPHREAVLALGHHDSDRASHFGLSVLGARLSAVLNAPNTAAATGAPAVWRALRPQGVDPSSVSSIADGVHLSSWVSADLGRVFAEYVGEDWRERQDEPTAWGAIADVPDDVLWEVRMRLRGYLVEFMRDRARRRWAREQASGNRLVALGTLLESSALTIGFARRFTDSARPELIFHDAERLARLVTDARRPVQIVFAGKSHAGDESGKHHLQRVFRHALDPAFGGRIAFLEDYDLHVARLLAQGCDVWLSTPRRGAPASAGALKAAVNGALHLGTPDAWWSDGCTGDNGWLADAGHGRDPVGQAEADARVLYALLEDEIVPAFYDRPRGGVPPRWTALMKRAIETTVPRFCARRSMKAFAAAAYTGKAAL